MLPWGNELLNANSFVSIFKARRRANDWHIEYDEI